MPPADENPQAGPSSADPNKNRYVDLGPKFSEALSYWSNDPRDMQLDMYFGVGKGALLFLFCHGAMLTANIYITDAPSVSNDFNMDLRPIIVKPDLEQGSTYLLTNGPGTFFFLWNEADGKMWRFRQEGLKMEDVVDKVRTSTYNHSELVRQFYNPQGRRNPSRG